MLLMLCNLEANILSISSLKKKKKNKTPFPIESGSSRFSRDAIWLVLRTSNTRVSNAKEEKIEGKKKEKKE